MMLPTGEKSRRLFSILKKGGAAPDRAPLLLAPMAGITDSVFRKLCVFEGADSTFTEMVSASGIHFNNRKTKELISIAEEEKPCCIQLFGHDPAVIAETVKRIFDELADEKDVACVDINMGCPAPKITSNGDGSSLMREPLLAGRITEAAAKASRVPISVKFRKGWDDESVNAVEFARIMENSGAAFLTVHGRTRMQMYSGLADRELIARVVDAVALPVVGNGDIFSAESARDMLEKTGCAGLMIARGAQGNPFIFREVRAMLEGAACEQPGEAERLDAALTHIKEYVDMRGGGSFVDMRKHIAWYTKGMYGSTELRRRVNNCSDVRELVELVSAFRAEREKCEK